jgi:hypothetical protein
MALNNRGDFSSKEIEEITTNVVKPAILRDLKNSFLYRVIWKNLAIIFSTISTILLAVATVLSFDVSMHQSKISGICGVASLSCRQLSSYSLQQEISCINNINLILTTYGFKLQIVEDGIQDEKKS